MVEMRSTIKMFIFNRRIKYCTQYKTNGNLYKIYIRATVSIILILSPIYMVSHKTFCSSDKDKHFDSTMITFFSLQDEKVFYPG